MKYYYLPVYTSALVISSEKKKVVRIFYFVGQQQTDSFNGVFTPEIKN